MAAKAEDVQQQTTKQREDDLQGIGCSRKRKEDPRFVQGKGNYVDDLKMPGIDGIETLREIKRKYPMVEVVMLTGHATVSSAIEGMKLGAFDYLMKPADIDSFTTTIMEAAAKRRQQEQKIIEARMKAITSRKP